MTVTHGLVGNTWQGLQLSITQGDTTITQAVGKPLTVTSPNTLESGGFNVLSESFCLGYGTWKIRMTKPKPAHPEMASYNASAKPYLTLDERLAPGAPINAVPVKPQAIVDWANETLGVDVNNFGGFNVDSAASQGRADVGRSDGVLSPFTIRWAIYPAEMRAEAEAAAAQGPYGMAFIEDNYSKEWADGEVEYEADKVVPAPVDIPFRRR